MDAGYPKSRLVFVRGTVTIGLFLAANNSRRGFTVFPSSGSTFFVGTRGDIAAGLAATINIGNNPYHFCRHLQGDWVSSEIYCTAVPDGVLGVIEVLE